MREREHNRKRREEGEQRMAFARLERVFCGIKEGRSADQVYGELDRELENIRRRQEIGPESERRVAKTLSSLSMVTHVERTRPNSRGDKRGVDMNVVLHRYNTDLVVDSVRVQVKSSKDRIRAFKKELAQKFDLQNNQEVDAWLLEQRLVLLNGQKPQEDIARNFLSQLHRINEFFKDNHIR